MADDATRARTRVIYCLEPPGADTYIFGVRLRLTGHSMKWMIRPKPTAEYPSPGACLRGVDSFYPGESALIVT